MDNRVNTGMRCCVQNLKIAGLIFILQCLHQTATGAGMAEWGAWGGWSECSRTCGTGIASRTRQCQVPPSATSRMQSTCIGVYKDFKTCDTEPCPKGSKEFRATQCEAFNDRSINGRIYQWEPYYRDTEKCVLACKAKVHRFYAKLAEQVKDGTRCDPDDPYHICVAGQCKMLGCDGILGSPKRFDNCGVCDGDNTTCHIVSGIYSKLNLDYGYNKITTIPIGACKINISESRPSGNYLALRITNGQYILNGNWALGYSNDYAAAGTVFTYHRPLPRDPISPLEYVYSPGPTNQSIDIMLLKQHLNRGIVYSYTIPMEKYFHHKGKDTPPLQFAPSPSTRFISREENQNQVAALSGAASNQGKEQPQQDERGMTYEQRYAAYLQRLQNRREEIETKRREHEERRRQRHRQHHRHREHSRQTSTSTSSGTSSQNSQSPSTSTSQSRTNVNQQQPSYSHTGQSVPQTGPNYGAPQNVHRPQPGPNYGVPNVQGRVGGTGPIPGPNVGYKGEPLNVAGQPGYVAPNQGIAYPHQGAQPNVYTRQRPQYVAPNNAYDQRQSQYPYTGQSVYSQYGGSLGYVQPQNRGGAVNDQIPIQLPGSRRAPQLGIVDATADYSWKITGFTECTRTCGEGQQTTVVICVQVNTQAIVTDANCQNSVKPAPQSIPCNTDVCPPAWEAEEWGPCSTTCDRGQQTRQVICRQRMSEISTVSVSANLCLHTPKPSIIRTCNEDKPCIQWRVGEWSKCTTECGKGQRTREVTCINAEEQPIAEISCVGRRPRDTEICDMGSCVQTWFYTQWSTECSSECGHGVYTRDVHCTADRERCRTRDRPDSQKACRSDVPCGGKWFKGPWGKCTATCGAGVAKRDVLCIKKLSKLMVIVDEENCRTRTKPPSEEPCQRPACLPQWYMSDWTECSKSCDAGTRTREVKCLDTNKQPTSVCDATIKPPDEETCNPLPCPLNPPEPGCRDKFKNCLLVVQARLCHYEYYKNSCCLSCLSHSDHHHDNT